MINVAIDGPVGAGKSTVARESAKRLGIIYVDTGAMYRACGLFCVRNGTEISAENESAVAELLNGSLELGIALENGTQRVYVNGEDVSEAIRTPEMSRAASDVSALPSVRAFLLDRQRALAASESVIMDGRDIGTVILPDADVKIFITAKPEIRAKRRYDELKAKGSDVTFEEVLNDLNQRDYNDSHRAEAPLRQAEDAVLLDTSELDFEQSVEAVIALIRKTGKI
ncbi:MAG: (d)CMP kinase [Ruminiclostridium sp.]|nr:(d)CMP kinase [Ruminiclostridium sp.]